MRRTAQGPGVWVVTHRSTQECVYWARTGSRPRRRGGAVCWSVAMPFLSARVLVPVAVVLLAWGGVHVLGSHNFSVVAASLTTKATTRSRPPAGVSPAAPPAAIPSPAVGSGVVPTLPGALRQVNGSTRDTATGLYALIQQLEDAFRSHLAQVIQQLEPGR